MATITVGILVLCASLCFLWVVKDRNGSTENRGEWTAIVMAIVVTCGLAAGCGLIINGLL